MAKSTSRIDEMTEKELLIRLVQLQNKTAKSSSATANWLGFIGVLIIISLIVTMLGLGSMV